MMDDVFWKLIKKRDGKLELQKEIARYKKRFLDVVLCIDNSNDMQERIESLHNNASDFYNNLVDAVKKMNESINVESLRIRVIPFKDASAGLDGKFFEMQTQAYEFAENIKKIEIYEENANVDAIDAMIRAIKSEWDMPFERNKCQIVVVMTSGENSDCLKNINEEVMDRFEELSQCWANEIYIDQRKKKFILFAPRVSYYTKISDEFENVVHLDDDSWGYMDIVKMIASVIMPQIHID